MGRSAKPPQAATGKIGKEEKAQRLAIESAVRGADDKLDAPEWLSDEEKEVYNFVLNELKDIRILSNVDYYTLERFASAVVHLRHIEANVRKNGIGVLDKQTLSIKTSYLKDFDSGVKELALSPQARAKIGTLTIAAAKEKTDPVVNLLKMVGS